MRKIKITGKVVDFNSVNGKGVIFAKDAKIEIPRGYYAKVTEEGMEITIELDEEDIDRYLGEG